MNQDEYPAEHINPVTPPQQPVRPAVKKRRGKLILIVVGILILLGAGAAAAYLTTRSSDDPKTPSTTRTVTPTPATVAPQNSDDAVAAGTTEYVSTQQDMNLSFAYPSDWTVTPKQTTTDATTPITVASPTTTIAAADGTSATGKVVVTIRPGGGEISELIAATAAQDSIQIAYTRPTASQRQYPYLTFVHLAAASKTAGAFEQVIITGGQQFKKSDVISSDNLGSITPLISATFYVCQTSACTVQGGGTLGISDATWQQATVFKQTLALLTSFKLN